MRLVWAAHYATVGRPLPVESSDTSFFTSGADRAMPSILIADDDPDMRDVLTAIFTSAGMDVISAGDGVTALNLAVQHCPDVVLTDFDMPGLNGVQLCRALREHEHLRSVPLAILTGFLVSGDTLIHELGCCEVMFEPRSNKDLVEVVRALIEQGCHDHGHQGECLFNDTTAPAPARQSPAFGVMFSPPQPDEAAADRPLHDGDAKDQYPAVLPAAHNNASRSTPRSWRIDSAPSSRTEQ